MNKERVYSPLQAALCSFAGPIATTLTIAQNYKALGNQTAFGKTIAIGLLLSLLLIAGLPFLPEQFPKIGLPILSAVFSRFFVEKKQFSKKAISENPSLICYSNFGVLAMGLVCFFSLVAAFVLIHIALRHWGLLA